MKNIILFDDDNWRSLLPLTYTRPVGAQRVGILTIAEKWSHIHQAAVSYITQDHLAGKFPATVGDDNLLINSACIPTATLIAYTENLNLNESLIYRDELIAARLDRVQFEKLINNEAADEIRALDISEEKECVEKLSHPYQIFSTNGREIKADYDLITRGRISYPLGQSCTVIGHHPVFIEKGATIRCTIINTEEGPVYIGKNALVMEGCLIRGPFAMGENSILKMGAKIYGNTTLGPGCKVGGEVQNVVFQANSNKAHDGYLGNAVVGEWCNFGAGTNNSNLKNNYEEVKLWSYITERFEKTGLQFCGLIFGDHSKCAINTVFNTGTVIGVSTNIFGSGFPRNFVPSFSWGGAAGFTTFDIKKAIETAKRVLARRNMELSPDDITILEYTYYESARYRPWN
ncbi:MAG: GlmU family protein [Saprospiraceae bacterium]|nr:GlmU family protein [Saprospiraceae bacterium]